MPYRFIKNKWIVKIIYILIMLGLLYLMMASYFVTDFLVIHYHNLRFNMATLSFIFMGALFGYFLALNAYQLLFIVALFLRGEDAYLLTPFMLASFMFSMFSQYRWFRTRIRTILAFFISYFVLLFFEFLNIEVMIKYDFNSGQFFKMISHLTDPAISCFLGCLSLYLFFNYAPDFIKGIFPLGYLYTREYVENLIFQNAIKKTRLSVKITAIAISEAIVLGAFSIFYTRILFPDLRMMMNDGLLKTQQLSKDAVFIYNDYGIAFSVKMLFMELSIAVPIASTINFYAKTKIGGTIGRLSNFLLKFTDTTDDNRTEYLQTIKSERINTHDEITDLYYSLLITLNEVTGYIERIQEEQKLKEDLRIAEAASEAKSSFLSNMSHEIRTPINAVLGMNEMILRESNEAHTLEYASTIQRAGNTLLSLVNDILDFSKIEAGKMEILPVQYNLSSVINDLVNMIITRVKDKNLELKVVVDENIPDLLFGDEIRIKQCATNILTNAVKYTEKGSVTLEFSYEEIDQTSINCSVIMTDSSANEGDVVDSGVIGSVEPACAEESKFIALTVRVADTGIGIKEEDIQKLYSPFERIEEIRNRTIEGTGLGMSIVKKLLAMMNTRLVVKSVYGEGSDFSFTVLQKVCDPEPIGDFEKRYKESVNIKKQYHESFTAPDAKILVVDDTSMNLTVIKGLLKQTLVQVVTAESGKEALRLVQQEKYDLIFLDHRMPEMDGIETLAAMKNLDSNLNTDTVCIALTANAVAGAREFYLESGFADYLSKPIDPGRLENMLIQYLPSEKVVLSEASDGDGGSRLEDDCSRLADNAGFMASNNVSEIMEGSDSRLSNGAAFGIVEGSDSRLSDHASSGIIDLGERMSESMIKLRSYKGINVDEAVRNCGGEDLALEVIEDFKLHLPDKLRMITEYEAAGDIKNFTIQVHSLKSSARIIGAGELSKQAELLEMQGNEWLSRNGENGSYNGVSIDGLSNDGLSTDGSGDVHSSNSGADDGHSSGDGAGNNDTRIHEGTVVIIKMIKDYMDFLGISSTSNLRSDDGEGNADEKLLGGDEGSATKNLPVGVGGNTTENLPVGVEGKNSKQNDTDSRPEIPADELESAFSNIRELMEAFDYDNASVIYKMLEGYSIPEDMVEKYRIVGKYLADVDREKLLEVLG
ncbi:response regulator [Butyrivibrio sp. AC2005]|uniref:response regulator n=1 Tax=Butyrivibrio sp. AC2005 TaxID=1280672 RepID=UPI0018CB73D7|nr:response regulator [Butyrivibrio sp. AC2005]